jgi:hypothetical protein
MAALQATFGLTGTNGVRFPVVSSPPALTVVGATLFFPALFPEAEWDQHYSGKRDDYRPGQ